MVIPLKKFYKYFGILAIMLFSFYYTEQIALFMRRKDPIYETIEDVKEEHNVHYVNAEIKDDTIIPGINGRAVNSDKSFQKMKSFGAFNKYYLVFDQIKPEISLEDNKDKVITKGNEKKKSVSLVLETTGELSDYLKSNQIPASIMINQDTFQRDSYFEQINNDSKNFKETENLLNSINKNKNICIENKYNQEICKKGQKYLVRPELELKSSNVALIKSKIESGSIIQIDETAKLEDLKIILQQIKYKGLTITSLSNLIFEENNT